MIHTQDIAPLPFTGERVVPHARTDTLQAGLLAIHQAIYRVIGARCADKRVLDLGCGSGHGLATLARYRPAELWGTDVAPDAVAFAARYYPPAHEHLAVCDARRLALASATFDVVSSVEVIEHVPDAEVFLAEISRVLRADGVCFLSTPNRLTHSPGSRQPRNPFHVTEYTHEELDALLRRWFRHVQIDAVTLSRGFLARYQPHALEPGLPFPFANVERFMYWRVPPWSRYVLAPEQVSITARYTPRCFGFLATCSEPRHESLP
jgi:SAM-dependent methyltransferase